MEWIKELQVPGLILAGGVIWLQYKLLKRSQDAAREAEARHQEAISQLTGQLLEHTGALKEISVLLKLTCQRLVGGGR